MRVGFQNGGDDHGDEDRDESYPDDAPIPFRDDPAPRAHRYEPLAEPRDDNGERPRPEASPGRPPQAPRARRSADDASRSPLDRSHERNATTRARGRESRVDYGDDDVRDDFDFGEEPAPAPQKRSPQLIGSAPSRDLREGQFSLAQLLTFVFLVSAVASLVTTAIYAGSVFVIIAFVATTVGTLAFAKSGYHWSRLIMLAWVQTSAQLILAIMALGNAAAGSLTGRIAAAIVQFNFFPAWLVEAWICRAANIDELPRDSATMLYLAWCFAFWFTVMFGIAYWRWYYVEMKEDAERSTEREERRSRLVSLQSELDEPSEARRSPRQSTPRPSPARPATPRPSSRTKHPAPRPPRPRADYDYGGFDDIPY